MSNWKIGFAEDDITPAPGMAHMSGYGYARAAMGVLAPLRGQAMAMHDAAGDAALLLAADILGYDRNTVEYIRHVIAERHGLPPERVLLTASHTHWGPATNFRTTFMCGSPNPWYIQTLENKLLDLAGRAIKDMSSGTIAYGEFNTRVGCNRRVIDEKGNVGMFPNPGGSYDEHTPMLRITRRRSPKQILLVSHGCHPTASGRLNKWWPCWPGVMRNTIEAALPDTKAMFALGMAGDVKTTYTDPETGKLEWAISPQHSRKAGRTIGRAVLKQIESAQWLTLAPSLECRLASGALSLDKPMTDEILHSKALGDNTRAGAWWARQHLAYPDRRRKFRYEVQAWRFGGALTLIALEGEPCSPLGPRLRAIAGTERAMVIGYANETSCYVPTAEIRKEGGYEGVGAYQAYFMPAPFTHRVESELKALVKQAVAFKA